MLSRLAGALCMLILLVKPVHAVQSTIIDSEGTACMGDERSKKQTEQAAMSDAKKRAVEFASTYIKSETEVKNFAVEKDLLAAYAHAEVKVLQEGEKAWYKDASSGDCYRVKIRAEVIPDSRAMEAVSKDTQFADDPAAPLRVKVWTDKKEYKEGEKVKVFIRGNKPFYAKVLYKDVSGESLQILPNPHRSDNYFNGGTIYEIPSGNDKFELEVNPPFGEESITIYASSSALGEIDTEKQGAVYAVKTNSRDIGAKTRGIKVVIKSQDPSSSPKPAASEFVEDQARVKTGK